MTILSISLYIIMVIAVAIYKTITVGQMRNGKKVSIHRHISIMIYNTVALILVIKAILYAFSVSKVMGLVTLFVFLISSDVFGAVRFFIHAPLYIYRAYMVHKAIKTMKKEHSDLFKRIDELIKKEKSS